MNLQNLQKPRFKNQRDRAVEANESKSALQLTPSSSSSIYIPLCSFSNFPDLTPPDCLRRMMPAPTADDLFTISTVGIVTKTLCASDHFEKPNAGKVVAAIFVVFEVLRYF
ncbi:hypothetical protein COP2_024522 [Malus domestica]